MSLHVVILRSAATKNLKSLHLLRAIEEWTAPNGRDRHRNGCMTPNSHPRFLTALRSVRNDRLGKRTNVLMTP